MLPCPFALYISEHLSKASAKRAQHLRYNPIGACEFYRQVVEGIGLLEIDTLQNSKEKIDKQQGDSQG